MKAVIFAAGLGKRMLPLTLKTCKPMLFVHNKPILEHILNALPKEINEVVLVVGYFGEQIKKYFGNKYKNIKIKYVKQEKLQGTWQALMLTKKYLAKQDRFLVLNADDVHDKKSLVKMLKHKNAILVNSHQNPEKFGVVEFDGENNLLNILEKPKFPKTNFVSVGVYVLSPKIFLESAPQPVNGEYFLPTVINKYLKHEVVKVVISDLWVSVGNVEEYVEAHKMV